MPSRQLWYINPDLWIVPAPGRLREERMNDVSL